MQARAGFSGSQAKFQKDGGNLREGMGSPYPPSGYKEWGRGQLSQSSPPPSTLSFPDPPGGECPLTMRKVVHPVAIADGSIFERDPILAHLQKHQHDPTQQFILNTRSRMAGGKGAAGGGGGDWWASRLKRRSQRRLTPGVSERPC